MTITCQSCGAQYRIDESKVPPGGGYIKCKTCAQPIRLMPPAQEFGGETQEMGVLAQSPAPAPSPPGEPAAAPPEPAADASDSIPLPDSSSGQGLWSDQTDTDLARASAASVQGPATDDFGSIPLASSDDIELASSDDVTSLDGASDAALPSFALPPLDAPDAAFAPPSSSATPTMETPRFLEDLPAAVDMPAFDASDLPTAVPTGTPSSAAPSLDDFGPPPSLDDLGPPPSLDDLGPPPSLDDLGLGTSDDAPRPAPSGFADLPAPTNDLAGDDLDLAIDLNGPPAPAPTPAARPAPTRSTSEDDDFSLSLDGDLPAPAPMSSSALGLDLLDDLPAPRRDTVVSSDAPREENTDTNLPVQPLEMPSESAAPSLMDDLPPLDLGAQATTEATDHGTTASHDPDQAPRGLHAAPTAGAAASAPKTSRTKTLLAVSLAGLAAVIVGLQLAMPEALFWNTAKPKAVASGDGDTTSPAKTTTPQKAKPAADTAAQQIKPKDPEPVRPAAPALTSGNVLALPYHELREAAAVLAASTGANDPANVDLLRLARLRLAMMGEASARNDVIASLPATITPAKMTDLAAASILGGQLLTPKAALARAQIERLSKTLFKASAPMALVAAYAAPPKQPARALLAYDRLAKLEPSALDAKLGRLDAAVASRNPRAIEEAVATLTAHATDPSVATRVLQTLLLQQDLAGAPPFMAALTTVDAAERVAPSMRGAYLTLLASRAVRQGDYDTALATAKARLGFAPRDVDAKIMEARLVAALGSSALELLTSAAGAETDPERKASLLTELYAHALAHKDEAAQKSVRQQLGALPPKVSAPWLAYIGAVTAEAAGNLVAAKAGYTRAATLRPKWIEPKLALVVSARVDGFLDLARLTQLARTSPVGATRLALARAMNERRNYAGAALLYELVLWSDPTAADPTSLMLAWIEAIERSGDHARALEVMKGFWKARGTDPRVGEQLVALARSTGALEPVIDWYNTLAAKEPGEPKHRVALAEVLLDANKPVEAQGHLDAVIKANPQNRSPEVLLLLARSWTQRDAIRARGLFTEALEAKPTAAGYRYLGELELAQDRADEAMEALEKAIGLDPKALDARYSLARLQMQRGKAAQAAKHLEFVLADRPTDPVAAELMGDAKVEAGDHRNAVTWYLRAAESAKDAPTLLLRVGKLQLQELNMTPAAVKTMRRVLELDPERVDAYYFLGFAFKDLGREVDARQAFNTYLQKSPDGEYAKEIRAELKSMRAE